MKIVLHAKYKSIPSGTTFNVPDFCVITGKNGSGKSHILEAIAKGGSTQAFVNDGAVTNVLHIPFNGLNPQMMEQCNPSQVTDQIVGCWTQVNDIGQQYKRESENNGSHIDPKSFISMHSHNMSGAYPFIKKIMENTGKSPHEITEEDVARYIDFGDQVENYLFSTQFALTIKSYHYRQEKNELAIFRSSRPGSPKRSFLSEEEFIKAYGPPPWELINEILDRANLPYEITRPDHVDFEFPYRVSLIDKYTGATISLNDLSSGEKVLMSLAIAIYTTNEGGRLPEVLLLDEPDAPLHPQFSKLLIEILIETIVKKAGIKVIITTHSPSTVAMAPENSVFEIDRTTRTPLMVSNAHAIRTLTKGIDHLLISYENRRQVFVESKNDVRYYQKLFNILSRRHEFAFNPIFLEPHSGNSNCTDVQNIVTNLRNAGNDLVWGIIDFDTTNRSTDTITVLGGGTRYAIDNYVLEPLYVCLSLIRHDKKKYSDFGLDGDKVTYMDATKLSQQECQKMVDSFLSQIGLPLDDLSPTTLDNGFELSYPKSFLLHQGHDYENRVKETFIQLREVARGQAESALKLAILRTIEDYPQYLPIEITETFSRILGAGT